jgi:hypothetical protein
VAAKALDMFVAQAFMRGDLEAGFQVFVDNYKKCVLPLQPHSKLLLHPIPDPRLHSMF